MRWTACEPILADKPYWGERAAAPGRRPRPPPARSRPSGPPAIARTPRSRPTRAPTPTTAGRMRPLAQGPVGQGGGGAQEKGRWRQKRGRPARKAPGGQAGQRGTARKPKPTRSKTHTALNRHRRKSVKIEKTGSLPATSRKRRPFRSRHHAARHQQVRLRAAEPRARYGTSGRGRVRQERGCRDGQNCVDRMRTAGSRKNGPPGRPQGGGAVHNTAKRTGTALAGPAQAIMAALLACGMLNIGETPPSPGGRLAWSLTMTDPITGMTA